MTPTNYQQCIADADANRKTLAVMAGDAPLIEVDPEKRRRKNRSSGVGDKRRKPGSMFEKLAALKPGDKSLHELRARHSSVCAYEGRYGVEFIVERDPCNPKMIYIRKLA